MMMWCDISESMHMLQSAGLGVGWRSDDTYFDFIKLDLKYNTGYELSDLHWTTEIYWQQE